MHLTPLRATLAIAWLWIPSCTVHAAFYNESDILPKVQAIVFTPNGTILQTQKISSGAYPQPIDPDFILYNREAKGRPLIDEESKELTNSHKSYKVIPEWSTEPRPRAMSGGAVFEPQGYVNSEDLCQAGNAVGFQVEVNRTQINLNIEACTYFYDLEKTGNYLWIGTYRPGGHGDYGDRGLLVVDLTSGEQIAKIDTGKLAIRSLMFNPYFKEVWAVTDDLVTVVPVDTLKARHYQFYHALDFPDKRPEVRLELGMHRSNPLAVIAEHLPKESWPAFIQSAHSIPLEIAYQFDLYDLYMCCSFPSDLKHVLPSEFNFLVRYLPLGAKTTAKVFQGKPGVWRQVACMLDDPDAKRLCRKELWH